MKIVDGCLLCVTQLRMSSLSLSKNTRKIFHGIAILLEKVWSTGSFKITFLYSKRTKFMHPVALNASMEQYICCKIMQS